MPPRSGVLPHQQRDRVLCRLLALRAREFGRSKARQPPGAANALRGETLIYVIGIANNGEVVRMSEQEPSDWHAAMASAIDSDPVDLLLHRMVSVGEDGIDTVMALAFGTDRFP